MSAVLVDELGPRGRRRVQIGTAISLVFLLGLIGFVVYRFLVTGQFSPESWEQFTAFEEGWPGFLISGLGNTVKAALAAMVFATVIGFAMALGRLALNPITRGLARVYVEVFRSIPLLLFILFAFLGLRDFGLNVSLFTALVIGLAAYNSAVLAEIFRAGILSLDRGQSEAAHAIGLNYWQSMRLVILPQAVRRMTPAIVAQIATLTKDTSLGFVIGYEEFLRRGQILGTAPPSNELQAFIIISIIYFILIFGLSRLARRLEREQRKKYGASRIEVAGAPEDLDAMGEEVDEDETLEREPAISR